LPRVGAQHPPSSPLATLVGPQPMGRLVQRYASCEALSTEVYHAREEDMDHWRRELFAPFRRALRAAQHELALLERDLGLCEQCGDRPPSPLKDRAATRMRLHRITAAGGRRVA